MQVRFIDPANEQDCRAWFSVLHATDVERWPNSPGWSYRTAKAMLEQRDASMSFLAMAATEPPSAGARSPRLSGIAMIQVPNWENTHRVQFDVRVLPPQRRHGVGRALVDAVAQWAASVGRTVLHAEDEIPHAHPNRDVVAHFARDLGFSAVQAAHRRHLELPLTPERLEKLANEVRVATVGYRLHTFRAPWPKRHTEDYCSLQRRMSTDAPSGDREHQEEVWSEARIDEIDHLLAAQGLVKLVAVAEHEATGQLVAFSEIAVVEAEPTEAWQWATLVLPEHRGHRLGLATKLANLENLHDRFPAVRRVITGNAAQNTTMIAVNDMMGFEVVADQTLWERRVQR